MNDHSAPPQGPAETAPDSPDQSPERLAEPDVPAVPGAPFVYESVDTPAWWKMVSDYRKSSAGMDRLDAMTALVAHANSNAIAQIERATAPLKADNEELRATLALRTAEYEAANNDRLELAEQVAESRVTTEGLRGEVARLREAAPLLRDIFDAWEGGDDCYEGGDYDGSYLGKCLRLPDETFEACCTLLGRVYPRSLAAPVASSEAAPVNRLSATLQHDEGAIARCTYCKRYTLDPNALHKSDSKQPMCDCGKQHGWCGSFVKPGADAVWSGATPSASPSPASGGALTDERAAFEEFTIDTGILEIGRDQRGVYFQMDVRMMRNAWSAALQFAAASSEAAPTEVAITDPKAPGYRPPACDGGGEGSNCCDWECAANKELREMGTAPSAKAAEPSDIRDPWERMVRNAIKVLNRNIVPDGISDHDALTELYGIFDSEDYRSTGSIPQDRCDDRTQEAMRIDRAVATLGPTVSAAPSAKGSVTIYVFDDDTCEPAIEECTLPPGRHTLTAAGAEELNSTMQNVFEQMGGTGMCPIEPPVATPSAKGGGIPTWQERVQAEFKNLEFKYISDEAKFAMAREEIAELRATIPAADADVMPDKLLRIIAYAYQVAGQHNAPERILDVLSDPEGATDEQVEAMLPYQIEADADAVRDGEMLEWMMERGAYIVWSMDGETCSVWLTAERDGTERRPAEDYPKKRYECPREAIRAAMAQQEAK